MRIEELLSQPEGPSLEFKRALTDATQLARTLIAFANGKGGKLVVGVRDERREVVGIDLTQDLEEWIMNVASTNCRPIISPVIGRHVIAGKTVLVITVYPGSAKPYHLANKGVDEGTFIRVGSTSRQADQSTIRELSRQAANIPYDRTLAHGATVADLDDELIHAFQARRQERLGTPVEEITPPFLLKIGAATRVNDELVPTIVGVLLFSPYPQQFPELTRALIRSARFKGRDKHLLIDQAAIEGPLPHQIEEAARFVIRNTRLGGRVEGLLRQDIHEYPLPVIRELITNAVVHRDYSLTGAAIQVASPSLTTGSRLPAPAICP